MFLLSRTALVPGALLLLAACAAGAQPATPSWQQCRALTTDAAARLACFDAWAQARQEPPGAEPSSPPATAPVAIRPGATAPDVAAASAASPAPSCRGGLTSELSRYWELENASDCGTFSIRGYRPISLSWIGSDSVNTAPTSPTPGHTAPYRAYENAEMRIQLSVRTKIAQGLLTKGGAQGLDSLWFGYTQQSYWQIFNRELSRPFRSTDHEPELTYIYPTDAMLPGGWRLRYSGISAVHQSNGQSLPLSRSWNRVVLMAGMEKGDRFSLQARAWARLPERNVDDDNPNISDLIGRAELTGNWHASDRHTLGLTVRHSLRSAARGSVRLEWLYRPLGTQPNGLASGLRIHTQLFSGYGDSLLDYNRRRTVLSVGLSLVDF
jgi:phospholipase A1